MKWMVRKLFLTDDGGYKQVFFWEIEGGRKRAVDFAREAMTLDDDSRVAINIVKAQAAQPEHELTSH